jgi:hypothetical protein
MIDFYMIESEGLMVCRPKGTLDAHTSERIVEFVEIKEASVENGFHRFIDLTRLDSIHLSSAEVSAMADRRRAFNPNDVRVKSAFWATAPLGLGFATMYEKLLNSPRVEVRVFTLLDTAAEWLGVAPDKLKI